MAYLIAWGENLLLRPGSLGCPSLHVRPVLGPALPYLLEIFRTGELHRGVTPSKKRGAGRETRPDFGFSSKASMFFKANALNHLAILTAVGKKSKSYFLGIWGK
jgi:hypothetical protein